MGIMARLIRLCKADIHGVMDLFEDSSLLLRQHLRDMEAELGRSAAEMAAIRSSRDLAVESHEKNGVEMEKIEQDIISAMAKNREEIARMLIRKKRSLALHQEETNRHIASINRELERLDKSLSKRQVQYESIRIRAGEHIRRQGRKEREKEDLHPFAPHFTCEPSEAEIELELMERRETMRGGDQK